MIVAMKQCTVFFKATDADVVVDDSVGVTVAFIVGFDVVGIVTLVLFNGSLASVVVVVVVDVVGDGGGRVVGGASVVVVLVFASVSYFGGSIEIVV